MTQIQFNSLPVYIRDWYEVGERVPDRCHWVEEHYRCEFNSGSIDDWHFVNGSWEVSTTFKLQ